MTKLDDLDAKLNAAKAQYTSDHAAPPPVYSKEMNLGMRAFMEMLGVLLGSGMMGWALDRFFETKPIFMVIFIILGIIAAFFDLYKLSKNLGTAIGSNGLQSDEKAANKPTNIESKP